MKNTVTWNTANCVLKRVKYALNIVVKWLGDNTSINSVVVNIYHDLSLRIHPILEVGFYFHLANPFFIYEQLNYV